MPSHDILPIRVQGKAHDCLQETELCKLPVVKADETLVPSTPTKVHLQRLPPTPTETPGDRKRSFSTALDCSPSLPCQRASKRRVSQAPSIPLKTSFRSPLTPRFSILYQPRKDTSIQDYVSAIELKRASESILKQVNWDDVASDVASNRYGAFYRKLIRSLLQEKIDESLAERACREDDEQLWE